jgi:hypothetical protein
MPRYTVEPGRQIYMDGEPFISIGREGRTNPSDADEVTHKLAAALNRSRHVPRYTKRGTRSDRSRR